jgi:hypothetical protein
VLFANITDRRKASNTFLELALTVLQVDLRCGKRIRHISVVNQMKGKWDEFSYC